MKESKKTMILTSLVCLIPIVIGAILYPQLPEQMVTHWDSAGNPNGYSHKFTATIVFPGILLLVNLCFTPLLKMDPKYQNLDEKVKTLLHWLIPIICLFCSGVTLGDGMGKNLPIPTLGTALMGVLFIVIGNYMPKISQSYTVGIKLPWTLYSEENWDKTHRLAGYLWVLTGLIIIVSSFFPWKVWALPAAVLLAIVIPTVYSYLLYRKMSK
ncbi:MAG: SdpI family protein [Clostridiales bacterium]|nr:SdpI family protein [Candidatus Blautia equi]